MSLRTKFGLAISVLIGLVVISVGIFTTLAEKKLLKEEFQRHQEDLVRKLSRVCEESLFQSEIVTLNYLHELSNERAFVSAYFVDLNGLIKAHSNLSLIGTTTSLPPHLSLNENPVESWTLLNQNPPLIAYASPVNYGGHLVGWACLTLDQSALDSLIQSAVNQTLKRMAVIGGISFFIGLLGAIQLSGMMVKPIRYIVEGMRRVGEGKLESVAPLNRRDELGWMVKELNQTIGKLKELDEMKKEFVASVTHELRSPLTAIERFVSLLLKGAYGPISSEQQENLLIVKNNTVRLAVFVDDLLTSSKLEAHRVDLFHQEFDAREVLEEVAQLFGPLGKDKKIALQLDLPNKSLTLFSDRSKLVQVITNLVSNALKFTEKGSIHLALREENQRVVMSVADTGPGLSAQDRQQLGQKFYRSPDTSHSTKGTGLGLFISKSFLDLLGGTISFLDNPPHGTLVVVSLPKTAPK